MRRTLQRLTVGLSSRRRTSGTVGDMMKNAASIRPASSAVAAPSLVSAMSCEFWGVTPLSRKSRSASGRMPLPSSPTWILSPRRSLSARSGRIRRWKSQIGS